ncbi:hypothetical protein [Sporosarcina ureilytica]|uniref:Type 4 fimbrial biogenesis protein PilX N-terminal domain-containing protein n=1 Tax=Sporosarcina ureilytica TaxID=298596 RepID=A0A1D8JFU4_9BACL|nr:hypothetical protein [Sporosarcina ureilytica]AOV07590.1 hypothetical protein BI350_08620 [Sporosarcina ureilytica]
MINRKDERGSTLLIVLLLVAVFSILGIGLLSMNISASKQFNKKEEQVQARHLAEMGVLHYQAMISDMVNDIKFKKYYDSDGNYLKDKSEREYKQAVCNAANIGDVNSDDLEIGAYFVERDASKNIVCGDIQSDTEYLIMYIKSTGEVSKDTKSSKEVEAEIMLSSSRISGDQENEKNQPPTGDGVEEYDYFIVRKGEHLSIANHVYVTGNLNIDSGGGKNFSFLRVRKNLHVARDIGFNNHACIVVEGDLRVDGDIDIKNKNNATIVVFGDAYFGNKLKSKSSEVIYVKGEVSGNNVPKLPSFENLTSNQKKNCKITETEREEPEIESLEWEVQPELNAIYK